MPNAGLLSWSRTRRVAQYWLSWSRAIHAGLVATPPWTCGSMRSALAKHRGSTPSAGSADACMATGAASAATADNDRAVRRVRRHIPNEIRHGRLPLLLAQLTAAAA